MAESFDPFDLSGDDIGDSSSAFLSSPTSSPRKAHTKMLKGNIMSQDSEKTEATMEDWSNSNGDDDDDESFTEAAGDFDFDEDDWDEVNAQVAAATITSSPGGKPPKGRKTSNRRASYSAAMPSIKTANRRASHSAAMPSSLSNNDDPFQVTYNNGNDSRRQGILRSQLRKEGSVRSINSAGFASLDGAAGNEAHRRRSRLRKEGSTRSLGSSNSGKKNKSRHSKLNQHLATANDNQSTTSDDRSRGSKKSQISCPVTETEVERKNKKKRPKKKKIPPYGTPEFEDYIQNRVPPELQMFERRRWQEKAEREAADNHTKSSAEGAQSVDEGRRRRSSRKPKKSGSSRRKIHHKSTHTSDDTFDNIVALSGAASKDEE